MPSSAGFDQRPPAQPKNTLPSTLNAADHAERLGAEHGVHAADRQVGRQVRREEQELHAANEVGGRP